MQPEIVFHCRLAGRSILIKQLKEIFDCGEHIEFVLPEIDVHSVASLLKLYLRELPEPIVPRQFYEPVMKIVQRDMHLNPDKAMNNLQALLTHIPKSNYNLIQYLTHFLYEVSSKNEINKMTVMNLATVFVHCMIRPEDEDPALLMGTANGRTQVTFIFITEWEKLFKMEYNAAGKAVKVATLLDIGTSETGKTFNPDTSTPAEPASASSELLDLVLNSDQADVPEPALVPAVNTQVSPCASSDTSADTTKTRRSSDDGYATIDDERMTDTNSDHYAAINDLDPYSAANQEDDSEEAQNRLDERPQPPVPIRPAPLPPKSVSTDDLSSTPSESSVPPEVLMRSKNGSIPKPRPRKISSGSLSKDTEHSGDGMKNLSNRDSTAPPPTPPKPKSASFSGPHTSPTPEKPKPARRAPPPPIRPCSSTENHYDEIQDVIPLASSVPTGSADDTDSSDERDSSFSLNGFEDDEHLNQLLNTSTEELTNSELQDFITKLKTELVGQRNKAKELHSKRSLKHKQQLEDMAKKLDQEKLAIADAVERIISLQSQLQSYSMKYGSLD